MTESPDAADPLGPDALVCSARGCSRPALFDVQWNNPKIHTPDRRKHWAACAEHRDQLGSYLSARGFLRAVEPLPPGPSS